MKRDIALKLSRTIGEATFEIEYDMNEASSELVVKCSDTGQIHGLHDFSYGELIDVAEFFKRANEEIKSLKDKYGRNP